MTRFDDLPTHLGHLRDALASLADHEDLIDGWGRLLASTFDRGGRLLVAGNGGSAAEAQHLTAELVGRFETERRPLPALALHAETSSLTAIGNDFGFHDVFARQVSAHGRGGDVLVLLSTSGSSRNLLDAAERAATHGLRTWAMTGPAPNPLARLSDSALCIAAGSPCAVQEAHLVAVHALCAALDRHLAAPSVAGRRLTATGPDPR